MNGGKKRKLAFLGNWRVLLVGAILGSVLTAGAFAFFPFIANKAKNLKLAEWTGFGEDTTTEESVEKNAKGQIQKFTYTTKYQSGKTLWDWLALFLVPALLAWLTYQLQQIAQKRSEQQAELEREIATINLREEALQAYIDRMSELLINKNLSLSSDTPLQGVARIRTLTILRRMNEDRERKGSVIRFLIDAGLISSAAKLNLSSADLTGADLSGANLTSANLGDANLSGAILEHATLEGAYLRHANLSSADLSGANLSGADLIAADPIGAKLLGAKLLGAKLIGANLSLADLRLADLTGADLGGAILAGADLDAAILAGANLDCVCLINTKYLTPSQVKVAKNWEKALYSPEFRQQLDSAPEPSEVDKGKS